MFKVIDLFCGAGGTTQGIIEAEAFNNQIAEVVACINHDKNAIKTHEVNHPNCKHYEEDIRLFDEHQLPVNDGKHLWTIWASLECTNFSKAKGGKARDGDSRTLALELKRYVLHVKPDYIMIENVREFLSWGPLDENGKPISRLSGIDYLKWVQSFEDMGYRYSYQFMNTADHGGYTSRERYFGIFAKGDLPIAYPEPTHDKRCKYGRLKWKAVRDVLRLDVEGQSIFTRKKPLVNKTLERIYAGMVKHVGNGDTSFLVKYLSNDKKTGINSGASIDEPAPTLTTQNRIYAAFLSKYFSGRPESKNISIEQPAGAIKTKDNHALVMAYYSKGHNITNSDCPSPTVRTKDGLGLFLLKYYSGGGDLSDINDPAGTILANDKHRLVFIDKGYSGVSNHQSVEQPAGSLTTKAKVSLLEAKPFILDTQFNNVGQDIDRPLGVITASRKLHYLINPQWGVNSGSSIKQPAPSIIARQDKSPLGIVELEEGEALAIIVYEDDPEIMVKIKAFMAEHNIVDIKMRMLLEQELIDITGLPEDYFEKARAAGVKLTSTQVKKYIGNAVTPVIPKRWIESLYLENLLHNKAA